MEVHCLFECFPSCLHGNVYKPAAEIGHTSGAENNGGSPLCVHSMEGRRTMEVVPFVSTQWMGGPSLLAGVGVCTV